MNISSQVIALYLSGLSQSEVARQLGVSHTTVSYWLKKTRTPRRKYRLTEGEVGQIPELVEQGLSTKAIARQLQVTDVAILAWMRKLGVVSSYTQPRLDLESETLQMLYSVEGLTAEEVGARVGCSRETVIRRLTEMGVPLRDKRTPVDEEAVVSAYSTGKTIGDVVSLCGVSEGVVRRVLQSRNVLMRRVGPKYALQGAVLDRVVRLYVEGQTSEEIGVAEGVAVATIINALRRRSVPIRPPGQGKIRISHDFGRPIKFGSSWEDQMYEALLRSKHRDTFLFQGDYTDPSRSTPRLILQKPPAVSAIYPTIKSTYRWHPDFIIPDADMILEVKGNYWALRHWNRIVLPCLRANAESLPHPVWVLHGPPKGKSWGGIRKSLIRVL